MTISDQLCTREQGEEFARLGLVPEKWEDISFVWIRRQNAIGTSRAKICNAVWLNEPVAIDNPEWDDHPGYKYEADKIVPAYTLAEMMILSGEIITWSAFSKFSPGSFFGFRLLTAVKLNPKLFIDRIPLLKRQYLPFEMKADDSLGGTDPDLFTTFPAP